MANITLGNLRDIWQGILNWVNGTDAVSSPKVQTTGSLLSGIVTMQNAATATATGIVLPTSGYGVVSLAISGTFVATITFEGQGPDGSWYPINAKQRGNLNLVPNTMSGGLFELNCRGLTAVRANITAYTSGSVTVKGVAQPISASTESSMLQGSYSNSVTLLNAASATGRGSDIPVGGLKTLTFEVFGTATSFTIQMEGKSTSGTPYPIQAVNYNSMSSVSTITAAGLYQIDVTGLVSVDVNLTAVTGGNVSAQGKLVA